MLDILFSSFEQLLLVLLITVLLGVAIIRLGFPDKGKLFFKGLGRVAVSIFKAPVMRIHQAIAIVAEDRPEHEAPNVSNRQYLLNKFFVVAEGMLVLATVLLLSGGIVGGCNASMPSRYARSHAREVRAELRETSRERQKTQRELRDLDRAWRRNQRRWEQAVSAALAESEETLKAVPALADNLETLKRQLKDASSVASAKRIAARFQGRSPTPELVQTMSTYAERVFASENLRAYHQPEHASTVAQVQRLERSTETLADTRRTARREARFRLGRFIGLQLLSLLHLIVFVWLAGMAIEAWRLFVGIAGDVSALRRQAPKADEPVADALPPTPTLPPSGEA